MLNKLMNTLMVATLFALMVVILYYGIRIVQLNTIEKAIGASTQGYIIKQYENMKPPTLEI